MERRDLLQALAALPLAPALAARAPVAGIPPAPDQEERPETGPVVASRPAGAIAVLAAGRSFGSGGGYDRSWRGTGVPVDIEHEGVRILARAAGGTYCCGFTFAVATRALTESGALDGRHASELRSFQKAWYGATAESSERQCAFAVEEHRLGQEVTLAEAQAGDFVQLWRRTKKPSGHSVLFLGWIEAGGERLGLAYRSSQGSTDGIGVAAEYFSDAGIEGGRVDRDRTYAARLTL